MSTPRIGLHGSPTIPSESHEADPAKRASPRVAVSTADHVAQGSTSKAAESATQLATARAFTATSSERRAIHHGDGGDRGAWSERTRQAIREAASNPLIGNALLAAFNRGIA